MQVAHSRLDLLPLRLGDVQFEDDVDAMDAIHRAPVLGDAARVQTADDHEQSNVTEIIGHVRTLSPLVSLDVVDLDGTERLARDRVAALRVDLPARDVYLIAPDTRSEVEARRRHAGERRPLGGVRFVAHQDVVRADAGAPAEDIDGVAVDNRG